MTLEGPDEKNQNDDKELCCWVAMATFRRLHSKRLGNKQFVQLVPRDSPSVA